jgi:hypothetical protein
MVSLITQQQLRQVQNLPFCYLCGSAFEPDDRVNRDHVPAQAVFSKRDRQSPLWLPTHVACNKSHEQIDEKIGQLIALRDGRVPSRREHRRLKFSVSPAMTLSAVTILISATQFGAGLPVFTPHCIADQQSELSVPLSRLFLWPV